MQCTCSFKPTLSRACSAFSFFSFADTPLKVIPISTFDIISKWFIKLYDWNINPIELFLYASQSVFLKSLVELPFIIRLPLSYLSRPPITFKQVVFPEPLGPKIATNSFFLKFTDTPSSATCVKSPVV